MGKLVLLIWHWFPTKTKRLQSFSDIELWNASHQGDRAAFGELFRRHYSMLYQYGSKICTEKEVLEDSIQELFVELWQKKPSIALHSVKAYLLQALKFKLYKTFRNKKRIANYELGIHEVFEISHENFLIHEQENREKIEKILDALNMLPTRQKEVIYLKIYKGLSYEEVSEVMQLNYQVVRNLLCQALKTFRKLVVPCFIIVSALGG